MIFRKSDEKSTEICAKFINEGKIVIIPTDTVYGFSATSDPEKNTDAVIRKIKGRSETKPFIQLIAKPEDIFRYTDDKIPQKLLNLWPGPLTVIVNNKNHDDSALPTTAFRCPGDSWLRTVLAACPYPVYSTSVNRSGCPVLDSENSIVDEFEKDADLIILDGDRKGSLPSTIISVTDGKVKVIREGCLKIPV